jgi:hypothetical protein
VVKAATDVTVADEVCEECGYEPELKRTLGAFQVFAVSFAFISVAVGIFGTYDDVLRNAGPVGIWLWVIIAHSWRTSRSKGGASSGLVFRQVQQLGSRTVHSADRAPRCGR